MLEPSLPSSFECGPVAQGWEAREADNRSGYISAQDVQQAADTGCKVRTLISPASIDAQGGQTVRRFGMRAGVLLWSHAAQNE